MCGLAVEKTEEFKAAAEPRSLRLVKSIEEKNAPKVGTRSIIFLGSCLIVMQILDGLLTSMGVERFGLMIEGNPLLRALMAEYGAVPTLASVKLFAMGIVVMLCLLARQLPWVKRAMGALTCIYLFAAIIPWTYILFFKAAA